MITKYDEQYEMACERLEKAEQVRNAAQWEVVKCQREKEEVRSKMREDIAEQVRDARMAEEVNAILNRGDAARDAQKERIAKCRENAEAVGPQKARWA